MKIGRNDPCPCGSGKKYKKCCLNQYGGVENFPFIIGVVRNNGYDEALSDVLCKLLLRMQSGNRWAGACHATSAVLYVSLKELGLNPRLCVGEADAGFLFDHSWIQLDGKVIDLAISIPLTGQPVSAPIILDQNIQSGKKYSVVYGTDRGRGLDPEARNIIEMPFGSYMDNYPEAIDGLWSVVNSIVPKPRDIGVLRKKYADVNWEYVQTPR